MDFFNYITKEAREQGLSLHEVDDHILELRQYGQVMARFSQTGITIENFLRVIKQAVNQN